MRRPVFIFLLLSVILLPACTNDPAEVRGLDKREPNIETGKNITAHFSQSANRKAYLTAPLMRRLLEADTAYTEFPEGVHVDFYDERGVLNSVVDAKYARYFEGLDKVFLRDSIRVFNVNGDSLFCHTLWWDQQKEIFYTEDSVRVATPTQNQWGTGLISKSDFTDFTILNTSGTFLWSDNGEFMSTPGAGTPNPGAGPPPLQGQGTPAVPDPGNAPPPNPAPPSRPRVQQ